MSTTDRRRSQIASLTIPTNEPMGEDALALAREAVTRTWTDAE